MQDDVEIGKTPVEPARDYEKIVAHWFNDHIANSLIARAPVEVVNDLTQRAIPALVASLEKKG